MANDPRARGESVHLPENFQEGGQRPTRAGRIRRIWSHLVSPSTTALARGTERRAQVQRRAVMPSIPKATHHGQQITGSAVEAILQNQPRKSRAKPMLYGHGAGRVRHQLTALPVGYAPFRSSPPSSGTTAAQGREHRRSNFGLFLAASHHCFWHGDARQPLTRGVHRTLIENLIFPCSNASAGCFWLSLVHL